MSSSENRIIKDAKISSSPIVIVMHDFADLSGVETESTDFVEEIDESTTLADAGQPPLDVKPRLEEELMQAAKKQAAELLAQASQEINEMKLSADREIAQEAERVKTTAAEAGKQQGYAAGLQQGLDEAKRQMSEQLKQTADICNAMVAAAEQDARRILLESEPKIIELVLAISRKIICDEVEERPAVVLGLVRGALERVRDQNQIVIHVSPEDYDFILQSRQILQSVVGAERSLTLTADAVLGKGGCLIETSFGTVEAGIDTQLESIRRVLQGMLP
jgi:flagellar assembly protein FliH